MAIESLPPEDPKPVREDAISREWIKNALLKYGFVAPDMTITELIEDAPSVMPQVPNEDTISRQAAIEAIEKAYCNPCKERGDDYNGVRCRACNFDDAIIQIDALPPIEPDWPKGEWVKAMGVAPPEYAGRYVCSNCGHYALMNMPYGSRQELSPFCPNCGAMMKGADDE